MLYHHRLIAAIATILLAGMMAAPMLQAQSWQWARNAGGPHQDLITSMGLDDAGNSYVAGTFDKRITFGATTLDNGARVGLFIAKYNAAGVLLWVVQGTGSGDFLTPAIAVDKMGNSYVSGGFSGNISFGVHTLNSVGSSDMFVVRLDSAGIVQWARRGGGTEPDAAAGVAIDSVLGDCIVVGSFQGTATFDTLEVTSVGGKDIFAARYDSFGEVKWAVSKGSPEDDVARAVAVNQAGSFYVAGDFFGLSLFGNTTGSDGFTGQNIFLSKFNTNGVFQWAVREGGPGDDHLYNLAVDLFGNSYLTGTFTDQARFGDTTLTSFGGDDIFMAKFDGTGTRRWVVQGGGKGADTGFAVTVDNLGTTCFTGRFQDSAWIGGVQVADSGNGDIFVIMISGPGEVQWVRTHGGPNADKGTCVAITRRAEVLVGGMYSSAIRFGPSELAHAGGGDIFFGKLGEDPTIVTGSISGSPFCAGNPLGIPFSITGVFNNDNVFTAQLSDSSGSFTSPTVLGTRNGVGDDVITGTVPSTIDPGNRYRIRVISSSPAVIGTDNGVNLVVFGAPSPSISVGGPLAVCQGSSVQLDAGEGYASYQWSTGAPTRMINVTEPGEYYVTVANAAGCTGTSQSVTVTRRPSPAKPTIERNGAVLESSVADAYQWLRNDEVISGATDRRYTPVESGDYRVRVTNLEGCSATSDPVPVMIAGVYDETTAEELRLYPQPTAGAFTVELGMTTVREVLLVVRNGVGGEVLRELSGATGAPYRRSVDLAGQPAGVYYVEISSGSRRWSGQIVKR